MGQFSKYVQSYHPPLLNRALQVVIPLCFVVKAAVNPTLENILWAASLVVLMLPYGIAPVAHSARMAALDRRPILSVVFGFLVLGAGLYAILVELAGLSRLTSILIAAPVSLAAPISGVLRERRRRPA
ncbi:hypothetical protein ACQPYH_02345 [Kribbella sp. CA-245084]|uniref:hypothetical protein n=1 Tax=Kribbella sp. CA-245084 TaxID=3239940 RepID=UPI003D8A9D19